MSAHGIANQMRLSAAVALGLASKPRTGLVSSYDPKAYAVKVRLQPDDTETGWLPIETMMAGQGWGVYFGPSQGDQATVSFLDGDKDAGWCMGFLPSDGDRPPTVQSGEMQFIHKAGWFLKFLADGIHSNGPWTHTGDFTASGTVTGTTDVNGGGKSLKTHTHSDPQGGSTGAPT
jgi:hypothetical protein